MGKKKFKMKLLFANIFLALSALVSADKKIIVTCGDLPGDKGNFVIDMFNLEHVRSFKRNSVNCVPGKVFEFDYEKEFFGGRVKSLSPNTVHFKIESVDSNGKKKLWTYENSIEFHTTENLAISSSSRGVMRRTCANDENVACCSKDSGVTKGYCEITPKRKIYKPNTTGPFKVDIECKDEVGNTGTAVADFFWRDPVEGNRNGVKMTAGTIPRLGERVKFTCTPGAKFTFDLFAEFFTGRIKGLTPAVAKFTIKATIGDRVEFMNYENSVQFHKMTNNLGSSSSKANLLGRQCNRKDDISCCSIDSGIWNGYCELTFSSRTYGDGDEDDSNNEIIEPVTEAPVTEAIVETTAVVTEKPVCIECLIDEDDNVEPEFDGGPTDADCRRKSNIPVERDDIECLVTEKNKCKCHKVKGEPKNKERNRCLKGLKKDRCLFIRSCFFKRKRVLIEKCPDVCEGAVGNYVEDVQDMCKKTINYSAGNNSAYELCTGKGKKQKCITFNPYPSDW